MKFSINKENYLDAYRYLKKQVENLEYGSLGYYLKFEYKSLYTEPQSPSEALQLCSPTYRDSFIKEAPQQLQEWCEKYLQDKHWKKLRNAIRARQKRQRDEKANEQKKNVTLSPDAYRKLIQMSKELSETSEPLTLSETIEVAEELLFQAGYIKAPWDE